MRSFELQAHGAGGVHVVRVAGSVDAVTAPRLGEALQEALASGRASIVVELSGVSYASSAALRALLAAVKGARAAGGDVRLAAVQSDVAKVLDMAGFDGIVQRYDDEPAAVASFA